MLHEDLIQNTGFIKNKWHIIMTWSNFLVFSSESSKFVIQSRDGLKRGKMMHISVLQNAHIFVYIVFNDNKQLLKRIMIKLSERQHKCVREEKEERRKKKRGGRNVCRHASDGSTLQVLYVLYHDFRFSPNFSGPDMVRNETPESDTGDDGETPTEVDNIQNAKNIC